MSKHLFIEKAAFFNERMRPCPVSSKQFYCHRLEGGKRGCSTDKAVVVIGFSLSVKGCPQFAIMRVVKDVKGETLKGLAEKILAPGTMIHTDGLCSYQALSDKGFKVQGVKLNPEKNPDHLHWLYTIILNTKAFIGGTYHGLDKKRLQTYLDEFCYRFNHRLFKGDLFNHLLISCATTLTITQCKLTG